MKNFTLPQAIVLAACVVATFLAYKFLGTESAGVAAVVGMIINFALGRDGNGGPPPNAPATPDPAPEAPPSMPPPFLTVAGPFFALCFVAACAAATAQEKAAAAEASYTAEMAACVEKSATLEESKACRAEVRKRWSVADAGADQ